MDPLFREYVDVANKEKDIMRARIAALESELAQYREAAERAEKECERLRVFIGGLAEGDCYYGDGCPMGARHGKCTWCQARAALVASDGAERGGR